MASEALLLIQATKKIKEKETNIEARDLESLLIMTRVVCNDIVDFHVIQLLGLLITIFSCTTIQFINNICGTKSTLSKLMGYECFTTVPCFVIQCIWNVTGTEYISHIFKHTTIH